MKKQFTYLGSIVSYHRFGQGKKVIVAFHGYNQTGDEYAYFEDVLSKNFTIVAIDFFWHGDSKWNEPRDFTEEDMKNIALGIGKQEQIIINKFSICSFSMGARMARALVRIFPHHIEQLIFLSPPTFSFNTFLDFTTNNPFGLRLFRYFVSNNKVLLSAIEWLNKWKIISRSVYIFSSKFIAHPPRLKNVFNTWYAQRKLQTNFPDFAHLLNQHNIETILIVGKNDSITPPHKMIRYVRQLKNQKVFIVKKKHELRTPETKHILGEVFTPALV